MQNHNTNQSVDFWPYPIALIRTTVDENAVHHSQSSAWPHPFILGITPIAQEAHDGALETIHQSMVQERKVSSYWGRVVNRAASLSMN